MKTKCCSDPAVLNLWYAIAAIDELESDHSYHTTLLEENLKFKVDGNGNPSVRVVNSIPPGKTIGLKQGEEEAELPATVAYGYIWTSLGEPENELFSIPEYEESDRRNMNAATVGVHTSAPRAIENFLDMGHFPFVHSNILGAEPHTEVREYEVEVLQNENEIVATKCVFYQPKAATTSSEGADVEYLYRVPHPFCSILYKSSPVDESRMDVIALFVQPVSEEKVRAHMLLSILDTDNDNSVIGQFQQMIFGQDKPILENQVPKKLPLGSRAETSIRADKSAITYRRWLSAMGVKYGVLSATS